MTAAAREQRPRDMSVHRFAVGQSVQLKSQTGYLPKDADNYLITRLLPPRDNFPQYRIRSETELYERVAAEDNLKPVQSQVDAASAIFG